MTLFQYDSVAKYDLKESLVDYLAKALFSTATGVGKGVYLGLQRNAEVSTL